MAAESGERIVPCDESIMMEETDNAPNTDLKIKVLYDDCYAALRNHFLMTGKGRRPSLPPVNAVSNRLLAQLCLLRDNENITWEMVASWFYKLFPSSAITKGKLEYRCKKALDTLKATEESNTDAFLDCTFNEDELPEPLATLGLTRPVLIQTKPDLFLRTCDKPVMNNVVIALEKFAKKEGLSSNYVTKWLVALCGFTFSETQMRHKIAQISKKAKQLKYKDAKNFETFLNEELTNDGEIVKNISTDKRRNREVQQLSKALDKHKNYLENAQAEIQELKIVNGFLKEERDCLRRPSKEEPKQHTTRNKSCQTTYKWHEERKDRDNLEVERQAFLCKINSLEAEVKHLEEQICHLKKQVKTEQTMKSEYKKKLEDAKILSEVLLDSDVSDTSRAGNLNLKTKSNLKNAFSDDVHLTYMALQGEGNVSASNCSKVVNIISKHLYKDEIPIQDLPCIQTALNMSAEGHYLSKHQAVESMLASKHFMLGTDGTSREKKTFIERHIVLSDGNTLSLGFSQVISDNACTLLEKTIELFQELCDIYCNDTEEDRNSIFKEIISKMKCLMSDRAAVMKLFNKKLAAYRKEVVGEDVQTHFLYCNAHFLLGISQAAEKAIKEIESEMTSDPSVKLGRDMNSGAFARFSHSNESAACRVIRAAADVFGPRGDEKNGCRNEWLSFLEESIKTKSRFSSYRTNRFNNLFDNASALVYHQHHIIHFLENQVSHSNLKLQSILLDVKDDKIMAIINALSKFNHLFSFPYWQLINSTKSYVDFPAYVKRMEAFLSSDPVTSQLPVFPEFTKSLSEDEHVTTATCTELVETTFSKICCASYQVLKRQLDDFLHDGVFAEDIPQDVQDILKTCPLSNLTGERLFGDLDFDMLKRRRASLHLRTSLNMWKHNKTGHWINKKSEEDTSHLMSLARKHGGELQKQSKEAEKEIRKKIKENLEENERMKKEKELKERQRHLEIVNAIINQGGLCMTKEDVDGLMGGKDKLENLKAQIRYRKVVLNEKNLSMSGNCRELYKLLVSHLGYEPTSPPPRKKPRRE